MTLAVHDEDGTVTVAIGDRTLCRYRAKTPAGRPHIDELVLPPGADHLAGRNLVLGSPHDHVWHSGMYFCQKLIDGVNAWAPELHAEEGTPYAIGRGTAHDVETRNGIATISQTVVWETDTQEALLDDERSVSILEPTADAYHLSWEQTLTARAETRRLSSETRWGHYNGFAVRFARSLSGGTVRLPDITDPDDGSPPEEASGPAGPWCDYTGPMDGETTYSGSLGGDAREWSAGLTLFNDPANDPHPIRWFTMNEPYGFLAANPNWGTVTTLRPDESVSWRWGVWVHAGTPNRSRIETAYERFLDF